MLHQYAMCYYITVTAVSRLYHNITRFCAMFTALKMKTASLSTAERRTTSVDQTTRSNIPEDSHIHIHRHKNLKSVLYLFTIKRPSIYVSWRITTEQILESQQLSYQEHFFLIFDPETRTRSL